MNRQKILFSATILLVLSAPIYRVWSNWGLITVDVNGKPFSEVFTRRGQFTMPLSKIIACFDTERVHGMRGDIKSKKN